jgi:hypothetical protein
MCWCLWYINRALGRREGGRVITGFYLVLPASAARRRNGPSAACADEVQTLALLLRSSIISVGEFPPIPLFPHLVT